MLDERPDIIIFNLTLPASILEGVELNPIFTVSVGPNYSVAVVVVLIYLDNETYGDLTIYNLSGDYPVDCVKMTPGVGVHYIKLTANPNGTVNEKTRTNNEVEGIVYVYEIPLAIIIIPSTASVNQDIIIDGTLSKGEGAISYNWSFGDDTISEWTNASKVTHRYVWTGSYPITLKIKDSLGIESNLSVGTILIVNNDPTAKIESKQTTANSGEAIYFDASNSTDTDSDKSTLTYLWDFGDETTGYGIQTSHVYNKNGSYDVTLTIRDMNGGVGTDKLTVTINKNETKKEEVGKGKSFVPFVSWYYIVGILVAVGVFARVYTYSKKRR
jgi:PKD repeat protein